MRKEEEGRKGMEGKAGNGREEKGKGRSSMIRS